ncbi:hypothetical protein QUB26_03185 [Microcoleus sp. B4-C1]
MQYKQIIQQSSEPGHLILQAMFEPQELKSLTIVKLDKSNPDSRQLRASIHEERRWHQVA